MLAQHRATNDLIRKLNMAAYRHIEKFKFLLSRNNARVINTSNVTNQSKTIQLVCFHRIQYFTRSPTCVEDLGKSGEDKHTNRRRKQSDVESMTMGNVKNKLSCVCDQS